MNSRLLYAILAVQLLFAASLFYIGSRSRENRKLEYLERTHRATAGMGSVADFTALNEALEGLEHGGKIEIRALFGLPVLTAESIEIQDAGAANQRRTLKGEFWIYYPGQDNSAPRLDATTASALNGPVNAFVIHFEKNSSRGRGALLTVTHPVSRIQ